MLMSERNSQMETKKVVISVCYGGFGLSRKAKDFMETSGFSQKIRSEKYEGPEAWDEEALEYGPSLPAHYWDDDGGYVADYDIPRDHPLLIAAVETLGTVEASGRYAELKIVEIPADVEWMVAEYDGLEWVAEKHRIWG